MVPPNVSGDALTGPRATGRRTYKLYQLRASVILHPKLTIEREAKRARFPVTHWVVPSEPARSPREPHLARQLSNDTLLRSPVKIGNPGLGHTAQASVLKISETVEEVAAGGDLLPGRGFSRLVRLLSLLHSPYPSPFSDAPQGVLGASDGCPRARNRTSRLRFWAVAAKRNCSATFQSHHLLA